jgi:hypothetical protein
MWGGREREREKINEISGMDFSTRGKAKKSWKINSDENHKKYFCSFLVLLDEFFSVFFEIEKNASECFSFCRWQDSAEAEKRERIDNERASTLNRFACLLLFLWPDLKRAWNMDPGDAMLSMRDWYECDMRLALVVDSL